MSWLQTRESSTLVIVTFLASASLLLLTIPTESDLIEQTDVRVIGFWFASLGLLYRQITAWTTDRVQHNREVDRARDRCSEMDNERREEVLSGRNSKQTYFVFALIRGFLVLFFVSIPISFWIDGCLPHRVCTYVFMPAMLLQEHVLATFPSITSIPFKTILLGAVIALILSLGDLVFRLIDRWQHPAR